jgi:hypothetical protein
MVASTNPYLTGLFLLKIEDVKYEVPIYCTKDFRPAAAHVLRRIPGVADLQYNHG